MAKGSKMLREGCDIDKGLKMGWLPEVVRKDESARESYSSSPPLDDCKLPLFPESMCKLSTRLCNSRERETENSRERKE